MTNERVFENDALIGAEWEKKLKPALKKLILTEGIKRIEFNKNPELQKKGIDLLIKNKIAKVDVKTRKFKFYCYKDILIETQHSYGKKGWFYTSEADLIAYVWENKQGTNFHDGYLILIQNPELKSWFEKNKESFKIKWAYSKSKKNNDHWNTKNRVVPIEAFPKDTLFKFNPIIPIEYLDKKQSQLKKFKESEQSNLNKWFGVRS